MERMNSVDNRHSHDEDRPMVDYAESAATTGEADSPTFGFKTNEEIDADLVAVTILERQKRNSLSSQDILLPGAVSDNQSTMDSYQEKGVTAFSNPAVTEDASVRQKQSIRLEDLSRDQDLLDLTVHQIAKEGDVTLMQKKFDQLRPTQIKKKLLTKDVDKLTPLHYAARYNHISMCSFLVSHGADVQAKGEDDMAPLHLVAKFKYRSKSMIGDSEEYSDDAAKEVEQTNLDILDLLVQNGASVNQKDFYGLTPLHQACLRGNVKVVDALLSKSGIVIEAMDKQQMTPLHVAAVYGHNKITKLLLANGANIRPKDEENGTPLHLAAGEGNLEIVELLLGEAEKRHTVDIADMMTDKDNDGNTALHLAVDSGHMNITRFLLDKARELGNLALLNTKRGDKQTPLHLAASNGHLQIAQLLISNGAKINKIDDSGSTPLILAAKFNHHLIEKYLLECGAKINARDLDDYTALLIAANFGHPESIQLLIEYGADVTAVDKQERNVLHQCSDEERIDAMLKMLKDYEAVRDLMNMPDKYGNTPLHNAATRGHFSVLKVLLEAGAAIDLKNEDEQTPLHLAAANGRVKVIRALLSHDKRIIHDDDEDANTALHLAALEGKDKCISELIKSGANIGARNVKQWTPLDCSASKGHVRCATVLLEGDSPVDPKDKRSITPLHLACKNGHEDMVKLLLKWEADVSIRSSDGRNALDFAADYANEDCALAIIESPQWKEALQNRSKDIATGTYTQTPMRKLIRKMPDVAEAVFKNCLKSNNKQPEHPRYQVQFDFEFLDDEYACTNWVEQSDVMSETSIAVSSDINYQVYDEMGNLNPQADAYTTDPEILRNNHCLMIMVRSKRETLLRHPLVASLLKYKWRSYGRAVYYSILLLYTVFMAIFNSYMLTVPPPYAINSTITTTDGSCVAVVDVAQAVWGTSCTPRHAFWPPIARWMIIALAGASLLKEIFQIISEGSRYFRSVTNFIEIALYILCILTVVDFTEYSRNTGIREAWQWQCGAFAIFLSWLGLLLFMQNFPRFGIYVLMFTDIFKTFSTFFTIFLLFIFAFAFSFHALFQNQYAFLYWWNSIIKTTVMMIGEFEYDSLFNTEFSSGAYQDQVQYEAISYVIFVFFMIAVSIIIMNLLVGLAVDDIKEVQDHAELEALAMQVQLALDVEYTVPAFWRKRFMKKFYDYWPNRFRSYNWILKWFLQDQKLSAENIYSALSEKKDDLVALEDKVGIVQNRLQSLRGKVRDINARTQSIESMMKAVIEHLKINWSDEQDDQDSF